MLLRLYWSKCIILYNKGLIFNICLFFPNLMQSKWVLRILYFSKHIKISIYIIMIKFHFVSIQIMSH